MPELALPTLLPLLATHRIFHRLEPAQRERLAISAEIETLAPGTVVLAQGQMHARTGLVLAGAMQLHDTDLDVTLELAAGELFGLGITPTAQLPNWQVSSVDAATVAWLSTQALEDLCRNQPDLAHFFPALGVISAGDRRDTTASGGDAALNLMGTPIRALIRREPVTLPPDTPIREAAKVMRDGRISSALLVQDGRLFGLITDRDLRNRVLAQDVDPARPVADIATLAPMTLQASSPAFEALLLMARHNIHHVPVMDGERIAGMLTATDLTQQHSTSAVYLAGDIYKQSSTEALARITAKVSQLQLNLANADASAYSTGHIVTAITDAVTTRLLHLAEAQLGPAPVDYVWVAAGSQARSEQTARSDQDNCLILDDAFDETSHGAYFRELTRQVCDGLNACGYVHCPGEMMAMTDKWRQPRQRWAQYFSRWIDQPEPMALMLSSVFFDLRAIHGNFSLLDTLRHEILKRTRGNSLFLAHMVGNALKHRPPLGMFGNITLIRGGEHARTIDLKHTGIVPIVDLARVYALAGGLDAVNTHDRLEQAGSAGEISPQSARDLRDAQEFLGKLRIAHQAKQTRQGQPPDNYLALEEISNFERSQLKDAMGVVQALQGVLAQRYQGGRF